MTESAEDNHKKPGATVVDAVFTEEGYRNYLQALLQGNRVTCREIVQPVLEQRAALRDLYEKVFRRSLYEVGEFWEQGKVSVADEHLATAITESLMAIAQRQLFEAEHVGKSAVVACVPDEYHQIGAKMVADTFEMNGWDSYFLGANTPVQDLLKLVKDRQPDVVALSATVTSAMHSLLNTVAQLEEEFPGAAVWVGGQVFRWASPDVVGEFHGVKLCESLADAETELRKWDATNG